MMYCTRCGSDLKGNKVRCPVCGYEVQKMKMDLSKPKEQRAPAREERKPWAPPIPDQRGARPEIESEEELPIEEHVTVKDESPDEGDPRYVDGCAICGSTPVRRCFFSLSPLCQRHTVWMQIFVRTMAFGERVPAAPDIASEKEGRVPTQMEAEEAGMFFSIKPYHVWKRVR
jgi:hypothetical protein